MASPAVTLLIKDYDYLAPLVYGEVAAENLDLRLDRDTAGAMDRALNDPTALAAELSFARHLARLARGDRSWVGIPSFPYRAFRQRCFFVRRGSGLRRLDDLAGKRVGTNEWPATGNTWSRALLRDAGVRLNEIDWVVGSVDGPPSGRSQGNLPPYVRENASGRPLRDLLVEGALDALMCPWPPSGFSEPDSPIVRLFPDFRRVEQEYLRRTGIWPAHHIVGVRRELFEREPGVAHSIFRALESSKRRWMASRRLLADTTPWLLADVEDATALIGADWSPGGAAANRAMTQMLCDELSAQGLIERSLSAADVFTEFEAAARG